MRIAILLTLAIANCGIAILNAYLAGKNGQWFNMLAALVGATIALFISAEAGSFIGIG